MNESSPPIMMSQESYLHPTHTESWYPVTPQDQDSQMQSQQYPQQCYTYRRKTISVVTFTEEKTDKIMKKGTKADPDRKRKLA